MQHRQHSRRHVLEWLAASPALGLASALARAGEVGPATVASILDVFEMEAAAQQLVPPAHWGYLQSGVDGDVTLRANQAGYSRWQLLARRFVDVSRIDLATTVLGTPMNSPVMISPIGGLRSLHPEADIGVARAAHRCGSSSTLPTASR